MKIRQGVKSPSLRSNVLGKGTDGKPSAKQITEQPTTTVQATRAAKASKAIENIEALKGAQALVSTDVGSAVEILPLVQKDLRKFQERAASNLGGLQQAMMNAAKTAGLADPDARPIVYVGDIEGRKENNLKTLVDGGVLKEDKATGKLSFADPSTRLVFMGDLSDRGPVSIRVRKQLMGLKQDATANGDPDQVRFIWGNRDISKLRIHNDLPALQNLEDKGYVGFLDKKIAESGGAPSPQARQNINTLDNQLEFWFAQNSAAGALAFHREELSVIKGGPVSSMEAAEDYMASIKPGGDFFEFLKMGNFGVIDDGAIGWHGGASENSVGVVPGEVGRSKDAKDWATDYAAFGSELMAAAEDALNAGQPVPPMLVDVADGRWNPNAQAEGSDRKGMLWANNQSVIYGRRNKDGGNFRGVDKGTGDFYKSSGVSTEIVGHSPIGHLATALRGHGVTRIYTDNSMSTSGSEQMVIKMGDMMLMAGKAGDGELVYWTMKPGEDTPIGTVTDDGFIVRGLTPEGKFNLYKYYGGYNLEEKYVTKEDLAALNPRPANIEESDETKMEREAFLFNLEKKGKTPLAIEDAVSLLNGRKPIVVSAASQYGKVPATEAQIRDQFEKLMDGLDPKTHCFIDGGTDVEGRDGEKAPEMILHEVARAKGFTTIGFTLEGADVDQINLVDHVVIAGSKGQWTEPLLASIDFAKDQGGFAMFIGGGGAVNDGIEAAEGKDLPYFVMRSDADDARGASDIAARKLGEHDPRVFRAGDDLVTRLK